MSKLPLSLILGYEEKQTGAMPGRELLPLQSCPEHPSTKLCSAGPLLGQHVPGASPLPALHFITQLLFPAFCAFSFALVTSAERITATINHYRGAGVTAMAA